MLQLTKIYPANRIERVVAYSVSLSFKSSWRPFRRAFARFPLYNSTVLNVKSQGETYILQARLNYWGVESVRLSGLTRKFRMNSCKVQVNEPQRNIGVYGDVQ